MLADLKLRSRYDGFIFLAESAGNRPMVRPHHHVELELNLVVRGSISYVVGGRRMTFERGTLLWLFPEQEHQLVDRTPDARYFVAVFVPRLVKRAAQEAAYAGLGRKNPENEEVLHTRLAPDALELLRRTMTVMLEGAPDPELLNREAGFGLESDFRYEHTDPQALNAGLHHLLLRSWRYQSAGESLGGAVALHPAVRKALDLLSTGEEELPLPQLARRCGASDAHLSRMFMRQIGVSLTRYRNSVRLGRFMDLIRGPEHRTIAEAVYAAGFGSYAQFHRVFLQAYGLSPRECLREPARAP